MKFDEPLNLEEPNIVGGELEMVYKYTIWQKHQKS